MTALQVNNMILEEVRALRERFDEHSTDTVQRLTKMETHLEVAVPRITVVEQSIKELTAWKWRMTGISAGASAVISAILVIAFHFLK